MKSVFLTFVSVAIAAELTRSTRKPMRKCDTTALVLQACMPLDYYSRTDKDAPSALKDVMLAIEFSVSPQDN